MSSFFSKGLLPTVVVDRKTGKVLMLAFSSPQSLELTLRKKYAHFFSRERQKIWMKGEESGNTMRVIDVLTDCDADSFIFIVEPSGPACHTNRKSCFFRRVKGIEISEGREEKKSKGEEELISSEETTSKQKVSHSKDEDEKSDDKVESNPDEEVLEDNGIKLLLSEGIDTEYAPGGGIIFEIENVIKDRKRNPVGGSYTSLLFEGGLPKILGKIMEEAGELCESAIKMERKDGKEGRETVSKDDEIKKKGNANLIDNGSKVERSESKDVERVKEKKEEGEEEEVSRSKGEKKGGKEKSNYDVAVVGGETGKRSEGDDEHKSKYYSKYGVGVKNSLVWETADLIYHILVLLSYFDIPFEAVLEELSRRMKK
jgi:phosphoribosyl-ATP pyrophosphohydrolase